MKSEPKTPLQLRAESMVNESELLSYNVTSNNENLEGIPSEAANEEFESEEIERKEVTLVVIHIE